MKSTLISVLESLTSTDKELFPQQVDDFFASSSGEIAESLLSMFQRYFYEHLPSMTDIGKRKSMSDDWNDVMIGMMYAGQHQMI
ncbi:MAG: hypothetical protein FJ212_07045 [Ignavibacteria bacterium]|nr:hypothetical protein [Ignavibacteria bacterium]